ncbi:phage terminase small subunit [Vibrio nigripulchritudo]|uniref:phage terminase small subunit n=1 Tax=Vibrio nigripulchritudo TaxID=28173 RepID=UPI00249226EE|nr:phage terminase small subunit [Vibrio nigripulchritudo]BDU38754.1 hypothetical protein TUMSATVNIG2_32230 [Vibrio nigripulchritudo]BDU44474.1 hypothetical protein TUMSATVNIG3_32720 [Vibrio nigripulchritudo]
MISILMKRAAKTVSTASTAEVEETSAASTVLSTNLGKPWEEIQSALKADLSYVRTLAGSKEKDPFKVELIKKYSPVVQQLLETHQGDYGNLEIMWWFYLWHVDLNQLENIHDDFRAAIEGGLETPTNWKMDGQTAYLGYVFKYSHDAHKANKEFKREFLINAVRDLRLGELATNAPLKVKMFRLVGDWHFEAGEREQAYELFELVMKLDPEKGGRKSKLKELKDELGYGDPH